MFVEQLLLHSAEIDLDVAYIIEGSLFKSLQSRHIRRYQEWLATKSPYVLRKGAYSAATLERRDLEHPIMFTIVHVLTTTGIRNEEFCTLQIKNLKVDGILGRLLA